MQPVQAAAPGTVTGQERPGASPPLAVAALLAALAGGVDAIGYLLLGRLFVSFMSGNSTVLGVALARREWTEALRAGGIIALFVLGAAIGRSSRGWSGGGACRLSCLLWRCCLPSRAGGGGKGCPPAPWRRPCWRWAF